MNRPSLLLDTNIVSYLVKGSPIIAPYLRHFADKTIFISFITLGELRVWAEMTQPASRRRDDIERAILRYAVVPYDDGIAHWYGRIIAQRLRPGRCIATNDAWIAATALYHSVPLVTHNAKDFAGIDGLSVVSEATE